MSNTSSLVVTITVTGGGTNSPWIQTGGAHTGQPPGICAPGGAGPGGTLSISLDATSIDPLNPGPMRKSLATLNIYKSLFEVDFANKVGDFPLIAGG